MTAPALQVVPWTPLAVARPLSWLVVAAFLGAAVLERSDRERARWVAVAGWALFGVFWLALVPHFAFEQKSIVEGLGSAAAVPLSAMAARSLARGRDSLFVLSRAVGLMGLVYLPFTYVPVVADNPARQWLIETVAAQTHAVLGWLDVGHQLTTGDCASPAVPRPDCTYRSTFVFATPDIPNPTYTIIAACTGIGSIAIFAGGIAAVAAPLRRKLRALAVAVSVIYVLNLVRNVFIATTFGQLRLQIAPGLVGDLFRFDPAADPALVSYYLADRILAQFGAVVALVGLTWLLVRELPELVVIVEDLLYLVTGSEYDLLRAFDVEDGAAGVDVGPEEAPPGDD